MRGERIMVIGDHSLTVSCIWGRYRVWCQPCDHEEWYDRSDDASHDADVHVYGANDPH